MAEQNIFRRFAISGISATWDGKQAGLTVDCGYTVQVKEVGVFDRDLMTSV